MALTVSYMEVWKWFEVDGTNYQIYWVMFDPPYYNIRPSGWWSSFTATNPFTSVSLLWFQPWHEVGVCCVQIENTGSSTETANILFWFQQYKNWSWVDGITPYSFQDNIEDGGTYAYYVWVWVDPDEIRPDYSNYRFYFRLNGNYTYKSFTVSNLSFDTTPHPAGYIRVEKNYLCYVPPSIYSGSSSTWYKHIIEYDSGYSWANAGTSNSWYIWIPSSSSDHHIYYVTDYGYVYRTKESYQRSWWSVNVWSDNKWYIRMTPSTSSRAERSWYNYLCYVDGWWYKRRMWIWEIS